ncbi:MAG TPA: hypothetical protein VJ385_07400, partial [Fibrobacteria bacterium]|nr:hypothetical protein [Fibrobacteria bacterium]
MNLRKTILTAMAASLACIPAKRAGAAELATHLFPHMDGDVYGGKDCNTDERLQVGYAGRKSVGWIVFQTGGSDLSLASGASLTLLAAAVHHQGTLKVFALTAPVTRPEDQVGSPQLAYDANAPVASIAVGMRDEGRIIRLNLGPLLAKGPFHGVVIGGTDGLRADFSSKDSDLPPMIELRYAFATLAQVDQAIEAGNQVQAAS